MCNNLNLPQTSEHKKDSKIPDYYDPQVALQAGPISFSRILRDLRGPDALDLDKYPDSGGAATSQAPSAVFAGDPPEATRSSTRRIIE